MRNIAPLGYACQSSVSQWSYGIDEAKNALTGYAPKGYAFHTDKAPVSWWMIDLHNIHVLLVIHIFPRTNVRQIRPEDLHILISSDGSSWRNMGSPIEFDEYEPWTLKMDLTLGRFVRIEIKNNFLNFKQIEIFTDDHFTVFRNIILAKSLKISPLVQRAIESQQYEGLEIDIVLDKISPNDRVLELGASIGAMSTIVMKNCPPEAYYGVEANSDLLPLISKNHTINSVSAKIFSGVVTNEEVETFDFFIHKDCWASSLTWSGGGGIVKVVKVRSINFNSLLKKTRSNFLICDIEGGEYEIFNSKTDLSNVNKICLEYHSVKGCNPAQIHSHLLAMGFQCDIAALPDHGIRYYYR